MALQRNITTKIAYIIDNWIPPVVRDSKWFVWIPFRIFFGKKARYFYDFKDSAFEVSHEAISATYATLEDVHIARETDLNSACIDEILSNVTGENALEVGCGRGYLAGRLSGVTALTACDMHVSEAVRLKYPAVTFDEANIEKLPYSDQTFDTVICTHTLEHVVDLVGAINELRRVARKRLIIVVPKQRPYRYTFDLHIHFFPYKHSLQAFLRGGRNASLLELDGDWYYHENFE